MCESAADMNQQPERERECVCVSVCMRACVRTCVSVGACVRARACMHACMCVIVRVTSSGVGGRCTFSDRA